MPDVIVVGARCAGASTALLLARHGWDVLLIDRADVGAEDTLSTLYIHPPGVAKLLGWGVIDAPGDLGSPPIVTIDYVVQGLELRGSTSVAGSPPAIAPRRPVLDAAIVAAGVRHGVDYRPGVALIDVLSEDARVVGVRARARDGDVTDYRAAVVVGADGMRSATAARVRAGVLEETPPKTCAYYTYWPAPKSSSTMRLRERPGAWVGAVQTNDDAWLVGCYFPQSEFATIRQNARGRYLAGIEATAPDVAEDLRAVPTPERLYGTGSQLNFVRRAAGPGWALVGDASAHKDSITARGITDAFLQAELLAETLGAPGPAARVDAGLREYASRHYDLVLDSYRGAVSVADLRVDEERLRLLGHVMRDDELTQRYFSLLSGALALEDFLTDDVLDLVAAGNYDHLGSRLPRLDVRQEP